MDVTALAAVASVVIALVAAIIALLQLRTASRSTHASRMAEMSWQVYREYADPRIRAARGAAEYVSRDIPGATSASEYGHLYSEDAVPGDDETIETQMRRLLRYYNQVGLLLEKGLVDEDLIYSTIGPGLISGWRAIHLAVEWDRIHNPYGGSGDESAPRQIHSHIERLHADYLEWNERQRRVPQQ